MKVAEQAYSAGNLVTCDGYYEFDLDAAAAVIAADRAGLVAEVERLRLNVRGWVEWHRRCDADDDCTYLNDNAWCDAEALASTGIGLLARAALKDTRHDADA
jgi:hypothetical protein